MRVLFITNLFPVKNAVSNGEYIRQQAFLVSKFSKVYIAYPKPILPQLYTWLEKRKQKTFFVPQSPLLSKKEHSLSFFYFRFPYFTQFGLKDPLKFLGLLFYVTLKRVRPDLIHGHFTYECGYLAVLLGKVIRCPVIITVHESFVFSVGNFADDRDGKWAWDEPLDVIEKKYIYALREASLVIAVSAGVKDAVIRLGVSPSKVKVIGNGVDQDKFCITKADTGSDLGHLKKVILYIGGIFPKKGIFELLGAVELLNRHRDDFKLMIIGNAGDFQDKLKSEIDSMKLGDTVDFLGAKPNDELPGYISKSHVFCLPSHGETFSCVTIEALACGVPVVGTAVGVISDIIKPNDNGFIVPIANVDKLAEALTLALDKTWNKAKIRESAKDFFWPNIAEKLKHTYTKMYTDMESGL